ncbi:MAG: retention module-containing protein, partial [Chromatiales bacterium]|nr:retention module-containing protein [Chromatiales bacterium]
MATSATSGNGQVIGFVRQVIGKVTATSSDGVVRVLQVGDLVFADELIETGDLASIEIAFNDGGELALGRNSQSLLDMDVYQTTSPADGSEYAASIESIEEAILAGIDPTTIQEAPAAGEETVDGEGGTAVTVERTGDQTTPESGFETEGLNFAISQSQEEEGILLPPQIDLDADDSTEVGTGYVTHYIENGGALPFTDDDLRIDDQDDINLESAVIVLTNAQEGDLLNVDSVTGLDVQVDMSVPGQITVTLTGSAPLSEYVEAIHGMGFENTTEDPDETPRIVEVTVNDGLFNSNTAVATIMVTAVNDPPELDLDADDSTRDGADYHTTFTEGNPPIAIADIDTSVTDVDDQMLESAQIVLTNPQADDVLGVGDLPDGLTATVDGFTVTITGTASLADYEAAIEAITFQNTSENPSTITRVIEVTVNDGDDDSNVATAYIDVVGVNDPAELDLDGNDNTSVGTGYETTFTEDGPAVAVADDDVVIVDVDDQNIEGATIVLTNPQFADVLSVGSLPPGISATVSGNTVTLSGSAPLSVYEQAIQAVQFSNFSDDPSLTDRFVDITVTDGDDSSNTAQTIIHIIPVNDPPDAVNDVANTPEDTPVLISVLGNDTDPEGDSLAVISNTQPTNGTLTISGNGQFLYTPNPGFSGTDTFTYTITDGNGGQDTALVTVNVASVNDGPDAINDSATTNEDTPVTISVLTNDTDPEGDPLTVIGVSSPSNGSVVLNPDGTITYTPDPDFNGIDTFTYTITDGDGGTDTATVTVNVGNVQEPPVADNDNATTGLNNPVVINVLANDDDPDGSLVPTSVTITSQPAHGTVVVNPDGTVSYTPDSEYSGPDSFQYTVEDDEGNVSNIATVSLIITDGPVVTIEDVDANLTPADNSVIEGTGDTITGTATVSAEAGIQSVTVDGMDITGANTTPVVIPGSEGTLTITGYNPSAITPGSWVISYEYVEDGDAETHNATNDNVIDQFTVTVTDTTSNSDSDTLDIQILDTAPTANADTNSIIEDAISNTVTANVKANDNEGQDTLVDVTGVAAGDSGGATVSGQVGATVVGSYGSIAIAADGSYTYTLDNGNAAVDALLPGQSLTDTFSYSITDADGDVATTTVTITINGASDGVPTVSIPNDEAG